MATNNSTYQSGGNIWFGVAVGMLLGGGGLYLLGTKNGRDMLKKIIALAEDMELSLADVLSNIEEVFENENPVISRKDDSVITHSDSLNTVLDKIKDVFPRSR